MYGVPKDLNLNFLVGGKLTGILLGEFQLQFLFHPESNVSVEGDWELVAPDGSIVDTSTKNLERAEYRLHRLLGQDVVGWAVDPPPIRLPDGGKQGPRSEGHWVHWLRGWSRQQSRGARQ